MKIRNIPFGYQFDNGKIISHPVESQIVSNIYENYLQGSSLLQIAKKQPSETHRRPLTEVR